MAPDPTVFLVDDDRRAADALAFLLGTLRLRTKTFTSARAFLETYNARMRGCLVLDMRMPDISGQELLRELHRRGVRLPIIALTAYPEVSAAVQAVKNGAVDYLDKNSPSEKVVQAIQEALGRDADAETQRADLRTRIESLSPREDEVMREVIAGRVSREIAEKLGICKKTVEAHRSAMMRKMGVESVAELVRMVLLADSPQP